MKQFLVQRESPTEPKRETPRRQDAKTPRDTIIDILGALESWRLGVRTCVGQLLTVLIPALFITPALAAPATRPTVAIDSSSCVTSDCHANIKSAPTLHGPAANTSCEACHELTSAPNHTFRMLREGADLCTYCHEFDVAAMPVIHKPVTLGQCTGCHDPHGSRDRTLTREASMDALCYRCHENTPSDHKILHTPVAEGHCTSCHPPHASMFPKLLDAVGSDLCLACHDQLDTKLASVRMQHKALEEGCEKCHDPHGTDEPMLLVQPAAKLCESCHDALKQRLATATHKHSAITTGRACMACHTPHGSDAVSLLIDQPINLCMECHKDPIKIAGGRTIPAITELASPALHQHGAIKDGQCSGCHEAHGTIQPMLLTRPYSTVIYQPFSLVQYELCFSCHDSRLVTDAQASSITNFRNGERNLHQVHVKEGQLGRACAMCHTTHASHNERNIRDTVPFKVWKMPIRFTKTETGGSCAPGCHVPWDYDRENPVAGPTSRPTESIPAPPSRPAREPLMLTLAARDTLDRPVTIPSGLPSVVVFIRDESDQTDALLRQIHLAVAGQKANVIVILSGPDGDICTIDAPRDWSIVLDPGSRLAGQLGIFGWPMAMIVQADGLKVASFGGSVQSLGLKLGPYLGLANKTLDQAAVDRMLKEPVVATDGQAGIVRRNLELARRLLAEDHPADALRLLDEARTLDPDSAPLRIECIRALLALNRIEEAMTLLKALDPADLPPGIHQVLQARALLAQYRWIDARRLLEQALQGHPDLPEAHYLLGTIFEHEGQWQQAAREYRAAGESSKRN